MKSPAHLRNILNPQYQDIGVAVVSGEMLGRETDVLVVFFGTDRSHYLTRAAQQTITGQNTAVATVPIEVTQPSPLNVPEIIPQAEPGTADATPGLTLLGAGVDENGPIVVRVNSHDSLVAEIMQWTNIIFLAFIIFIILALLLNIFIRVHIQHGSLILQSLATIALISSLLLSRLHFIQRIASSLKIS